MENYIHNSNRISIRDIEGDIDISQNKWDYIFNFILERTTSIYFRGTRLEYEDVKLTSDIDLLVDHNMLLSEDDYFRLTFKVKQSCVSLGRGLIKGVWNHYEYPALIFLKDELNSKDFRRLFQSKYYEDIFGFLESMYIVYKNFESDVLWIEKTIDMEFPLVS